MEKQVDHKRKSVWTSEEDDKLRHYVNMHGAHHWDTVAHNLDIGRTANSCRLRWVNYLSPSVRREKITDEETILILKLHAELGNQWSKIATKLPGGGRTDNDVKNFWNIRLKKEARQLSCEVESEEFRELMTAKVRGRIQVPPPTTVAGGCGCGGGIATSLGESSSSTRPIDDSPSFRTWL